MIIRIIIIIRKIVEPKQHHHIEAFETKTYVLITILVRIMHVYQWLYIDGMVYASYSTGTASYIEDLMPNHIHLYSIFTMK